MMRRMFAGMVLSACFGTGLQAQDSVATSSRDTLYRRAQRLVNEGKGDQGRAIVDSLLRVAAPGTAAYVEGLFWRASLATTSAEAERDYRQITVDFPLSSRTEDALLRLAQLELQRGDRALALAHLERLFRENGTGTTRARAGYWMARVYFEQNDVARGCVALAESRAAIAASDVELRNQVDYAAQRCPVVAPVVRQTATAALPPRASLPPAPDTVIARADTTRVAAPQNAPATPPTAPVGKVVGPKATAPNHTEPQRFSVQVAAYGTAQEAERLVKQYRANGHDARVSGTVAPFRVRIGRFKTRGEAAELAKVLKAKSGAAFVVVAEPR